MPTTSLLRPVLVVVFFFFTTSQASASTFSPSEKGPLAPCTGNFLSAPSTAPSKLKFSSGVVADSSAVQLTSQRLRKVSKLPSVTPEYISRWSKFQEALNVAEPSDAISLEAQVKRQAAKVAELSSPLRNAALVEVLQTAEGKAKISALQRRLDPLIVQGYAAKPFTELTNRDFSNLVDDSGFRVLTVKAGLARSARTFERFASDKSQQSVGAGTEAPTGALTDVPLNQQLVLMTNAAGGPCLAAAQSNDVKFDPVTNKIPLVWDRAGFADVGMLLQREKNASGKRLHICSFVRVSESFALTAAHCVVSSKAGQKVAMQDASSDSMELLAAIPKLQPTHPPPSSCFDLPNDCGHWVASVSGRALLHPEVTWPIGEATPLPDIAILKLKFPYGAVAVHSKIATKPMAAGRLTVAGFGLTNAGSGNVAGALLVGWQTWDASQDEMRFSWASALRDGQLVPCAGDSGAPVFQGQYNGAVATSGPAYVKTLAALISTNNEHDSYASDDLRRCAESTKGTAARIDTHAKWLCEASGSQISGCANLGK